MRIAKVKIANFRGIAQAELQFSGHTVLVGDNNSGKSTVLEAIDLVLGPDRLSRISPIDEHDFYAGRYLDDELNPVAIEIELVIVDLIPEQIRHFKDHLEFWDDVSQHLLSTPPIEAIDSTTVKEALRVRFKGSYSAEDDEFEAETLFCSPESESGNQSSFKSHDKRMCGFLYLRSLRTGSRALSLERGSLLDIILRVREIRPKMWEQVLTQLRSLPVADAPEIGVSEILTGFQSALNEFVPDEWASNPHLRVSDLTRDHLRRTLTVFMATGAKTSTGQHAAPFQHQGTGTTNVLVLALLSMIAESKKTVIFAMEEPETAIPPSTQKSIVSGVRTKSSQAIFTSHSPYVLEEFDPEQIFVLARNSDGKLTSKPAKFPSHIKPKAYSSEFRMRFAEALLSRRVLILEGQTEHSAYPVAARRLAELDPERYSSLESLDIAVFCAKTDSQIAASGELFRDLNKKVFAIYDRQTDLEQKRKIEAAVDHAFEAPSRGFEVLLVSEIAEDALRRFAAKIVASGDWPSHLNDCKPEAGTTLLDLQSTIKKFLIHGKGEGYAGDLLVECTLAEMPATVKDNLEKIKTIACPPLPSPSVISAEQDNASGI
jgi:putative ATP-dependent endonuclease of OLD family